MSEWIIERKRTHDMAGHPVEVAIATSIGRAKLVIGLSEDEAADAKTLMASVLEVDPEPTLTPIRCPTTFSEPIFEDAECTREIKQPIEMPETNSTWFCKLMRA